MHPTPDSSPSPFVVSCEHAGNVVPPPWDDDFRVPAEVLRGHRGHDPGSEDLGRALADARGAPLVVNRVTRLLVDANRGASNRARWSEYARRLRPELRARAERHVWSRHRHAVERAVRDRLGAGAPVVHLAAHSFTPVLDGRARDVDVGLLYDPRREGERSLAARWAAELSARRPDLVVRRNAPYKGTSDGLPTELRRRLGADEYIGIEVEVSQRFPLDRSRAGRASWTRLLEDLTASLPSS